MRFISILFLLSLLFSCKTQEDNYMADVGHDYLRLEVGKFIEYQVDSTVYDPTGDTSVTTVRSYLRDVIVDTLRDNVGQLLYKTERFHRRDTTAAWDIEKVYTQSIQGNQGIVTEDNLRFIKLAFPIREFNSWDPLVHIDKELIITVAGETLQPFRNNAWRSRILSASEPDTIGNFQFDDVLSLREADTDGESTIDLRASYEKYARGIGLVFRERWILDTDKCQQECNPLEITYQNCYDPCFFNCQNSGMDSLQCENQCRNECIDEWINFTACQTDCEALPWQERATKGYIMRMEVVRFN